VSHAATVIALGRAIVRDREMAIRAGTCSLSKYVREDRTWRCELNGWTGHLAQGEQVGAVSLYWEYEAY